MRPQHHSSESRLLIEPLTGPLHSSEQPRIGEDTEVQDAEARELSQSLSLRSLQTPGAIPGYHIEQCLGEGSFGSVWLAREVRTGKKVAIKFYSRGRGVDWSLLSREVEKLAVLYTSRNIVRLLDVAWDHDPPYFVMEYLENGSLAQKLERGKLPVEDSVRITKSIAQALVHAHGSGVLHCDLKPANVLFDASGDARLCDFGQSRLSSERTPALGTLFYMAPEQAVLDGVPDARWDVYALGALLYQMLTGNAPGRGDQTERILRQAGSTEERLAAYRQLLQDRPPPTEHRDVPGVDKRLAAILEQCLQKNPAERLANVQIVLDQLEARDRARSRRPLMILALVGPLVFLTAMYWMAETVFPNIVSTAKENLSARALAGDVVSARILAESIEQEVIHRIEELETEAATSHVRQIVNLSGGMTADQLQAVCRDSSSDSEIARGIRLLNQTRAQASAIHQDRSWFLTDAQGRQIYRFPVEGDAGKSSIGNSFRHRDYFHGRGQDLETVEAASGVTPRVKSGVSAAYLSSNTGQYAIAITVPVWNEDKSQVIGVLGRSLHLTDLLDQWEKQLQGEARPDQRFLSLVEDTTEGLRLLDHHWTTPANMANRTEEIRIPSTTAQLLRDKDRTDKYQDPIAEYNELYRGDWLAAWAEVDGTRWIAIVQENRELALEPVGQLQNVFQRAGAIAIGVFSLMLGGFWLLLKRVSD